MIFHFFVYLFIIIPVIVLFYIGGLVSLFLLHTHWCVVLYAKYINIASNLESPVQLS